MVVLETSGIPLFAEDGTFIGYRGIDRDITPAIGPLNPRLVQLEALYAAAPVALGLVDREGRLVNANHALARLLGTEGQPVTGHTVARYLPPEQLDVIAMFARLEAGEEVPGRELTKVGRSYQVTAQAVRNLDGTLIGMTLALTDVTELQRVRLQLAEANARLANANAQLSELAETDYLTGLPNRRRFDETLLVEVARAVRERLPLSLLMLDVDFFKTYNDHYGHQAGDECLRALARLLREGIFRPADLPCRYGGEEFAVILPHTDALAAGQVAERLRTQLQAAGLPHELAPTGQITASIGIATFDGRSSARAGTGGLAAELVGVATAACTRPSATGATG